MLNKKIVSGVMTCAIALGLGGQAMPVCAAEYSKTDAKVNNTASFSTDVIYQIVTDRFEDGNPSNNPSGEIFNRNDGTKYHGGDWQGIINKIEDGYLTDMGITALWITSPVENIMTIDPSNNCASYHGYWAKDFFRTNSAFGTEADFKKLISVAHQNGIKIVIDFAPNHTSCAELLGVYFPEDGAIYKDGEFVQSYSKDSEKDGFFNHHDWTDYTTLENSIYHSMSGLADINHLNPSADKYMKEAIDKWLDMGVDGIRVDAVKHMAQGWQTNWLSDIYENHQPFVFGEWYDGDTANNPEMTHFANTSGMNLLDFRYSNAIRNVLGYRGGTSSMKDLYGVIKATESDYNEVNDQVTFIDNHDMARFASISNNNSDVDKAYVLLLTSRGVPNIYYGSEQYSLGVKDPANRADMPSFNKNTTAYKVISKLAPLRKENAALAYGSTNERWVNDDVLFFERKFGNDVALVAVNRNNNESCDISGLLTDLPEGEYKDELDGVMNGKSISVDEEGSVTDFTLGAGACAVWTYTSEEQPLEIGNVDPGMGVAGNIVTISGRGFGSSGSVSFGTNAAEIVSWSDTLIKVKVPAVEAGKYQISVDSEDGGSDVYSAKYNVLTNSQIAARFIVRNAETEYGSNVYIVGNVEELGGWNPKKAVGPFFNNTTNIVEYPDWFYDINVPADTDIEFKFIKKDSQGNVIWESGENHTFTTGHKTTEKIDVDWQ